MNLEIINRSILQQKSNGGFFPEMTPIQVIHHPMHRESHWEDVDVPLEDFGITLDIDVWLDSVDKLRYPGDKHTPTRAQLKKRVAALDIRPAGFMLLPACQYHGKVLLAKTRVQRDIKESPYGEYYLHGIGRQTVLRPETFKKESQYRIRYASYE